MNLNKINIEFKIVIITLCLIILNGCEDVITVDLKKAETKIVIEGSVSDQPGPYQVLISKSTDYFNPAELNKISGALVTISDELGNSEILKEVNSGVYNTIDFKTGAEGKYFLEVNIDDKKYNAKTSLVKPLIVDSLSVTLEEDGYELSAHFQDNKNKSDYAIINYRVNDGELSSPVLYSDRLSDGKYIESDGIEIDLSELISGVNKIECTVRTIDVEMYSYYRALLNSLAEQDDNSLFDPTAPENPKSNISNGVLGYFGAYAISKKVIYVEN